MLCAFSSSLIDELPVSPRRMPKLTSGTFRLPLSDIAEELEKSFVIEEAPKVEDELKSPAGDDEEKRAKARAMIKKVKEDAEKRVQEEVAARQKKEEEDKRNRKQTTALAKLERLKKKEEEAKLEVLKVRRM